MPGRNFQIYHEDENDDLLSHKGKEEIAGRIHEFRDPTKNLLGDLVDILFDRFIKKIRKSTN